MIYLKYIIEVSYGIIYIMDFIIIRSVIMDIGISAHIQHYIHGIGIIITLVTSDHIIVITDLDHVIMIGTGLIIMKGQEVQVDFILRIQEVIIKELIIVDVDQIVMAE